MPAGFGSPSASRACPSARPAGEHRLLDRLAHPHGNRDAGPRRRLHVPAVDLDARRQADRRRIAVRDVDPLHARRVQCGYRVRPRLQRRRAHAVGEAVLHGGNVEVVRPAGSSLHFGAPLSAVAVRHDHDGRRAGRRTAAGVERGVQPQGPPHRYSGVTRLDMQRGRMRKGIQPGRAPQAAERIAARGKHQQQAGHGGANLQGPPADFTAGHDQARIHPARMPRGIAHHQLPKRRGTAAAGDVRGTGQAVLQRRTALFDVARHLAVVRRDPQPPHGPGQRGDRHQQRRGRQCHHRRVAGQQQPVGRQQHQQARGNGSSRRRGHPQRAGGLPAAAHAPQEREQFVECR